MTEKRIKISSVLENQIPQYVREEYPLVSEFLTQYYTGLEYQGGILDVLQNIDFYTKLDNLANLIDSTTTTSSITFFDDTIFVDSTAGFPDSYGLIQIDSEIITYTSKTSTSFEGCFRGFSAVSSYHNPLSKDSLVFSETEASDHDAGSTVENLSVLFLKEFFKKLKYQIAPGFEDREFTENLDERLFLKQVNDFYSAKGTDESFRILFSALYGDEIKVIKPRDYLFKPSDAQYRITKDIVVEPLEGDPLLLLNRTLIQDQSETSSKASGAINSVERISRGNKEYYILSLNYDYNSDIGGSGNVSGDFSIHARTRLTEDANIDSTILDVDSTVGFSASGSLVVNFDDGDSITITYQSKSLTQFIGCSGITRELSSGQDLIVNDYAYGYAGISTENPVKVRVTGVLSDIKFLGKSLNFEENDIIKIKSLGKELKDHKSNNWIFNISTKYNVSAISLRDDLNFTYTVTLEDPSIISIGDKLRLFSSDGVSYVSNVLTLLSDKSFTIGGQGIIDTSKKYVAQKLITKINSSNYPELNSYQANVQNVYSADTETFIAASSFPNYSNTTLSINDTSVTFSGVFSGENLKIGNHGFYTGDSVFYSFSDADNSLGIPARIYYVKRVDDKAIKLAYSRSDIYNNKFITVNATINADGSENKFISYDFYDKKPTPQKLLRKISNPTVNDITYETNPGFIGILVNGVEILNYKSKDKVFYGSLESVDVLDEGKNYDVINPPNLVVTDDSGSGAELFCDVEGSLKRIEIVDGGFDYVTEPVVNITGGNGSGALTKVNLISFEYSASFNSSQSSGLVNLTQNSISFSDYHKFRDGEQVVYRTSNQSGVGGLTTNTSYYVSIQDPYTVKVHFNYQEAISGINTVNLTSYGNGNHDFRSVNLKKKIGSIDVINPGSGYRNKKTTTTSVGINTFDSFVTIKNHGYKSGEILSYQNQGTPISGLSTNQQYYVTVLDENTFKLSDSNFTYNTKQYISLNSVGVGTHIFNYTPISVTVSGVIGVSTLSGQNFQAVVNPVFRGQIKSVFVSKGGEKYGSEEIIGYNKQPSYNLVSGSGAVLVPIINNGTIVDVNVLNGGSNYNSSPNLVLAGSGTGAILTPIIEDGKIARVKIISGGVGYTKDYAYIFAESSGIGCKLNFNPQKWTINLVEKYIKSNLIGQDDGFVDKSVGGKYGLQYAHMYAPRKLRQICFSSNDDGSKSYVPDLILKTDREVKSTKHSPIIGWAYDGNPIYGPYGYSSEIGGTVKQLKSGYRLNSSSSRPSSSLYPQGFFVEDYVFDYSGDLDEFNGRYCITPEYPNGTYAYFSTFNEQVDSDGVFNNYRRPQFPYFIGNNFKSKLITFNYAESSNQDDIDLTTTTWVRNTTPYNLNNKNSFYDFILNPNKLKEQNSIVRNSKLGKISSIQILSGGDNYKVGDRVVFENSKNYAFSASTNISGVKGKEVNSVSTSSTTIYDVEFVPFTSTNKFIGFSKNPHTLSNNDFIKISGISTDNSGIDGPFTVGVRTDTFVLQNSVSNSASTGIVTYFDVYGTLRYPFINIDDIFQIDSEEVKVLYIDPESSRIRVQREYNGTVGSAHSASTVLYERSRKFEINVGVTTSNYNYNLNKKIYFIPTESLGIGTISGVGVGYTLSFSNPGIGLTSVFIPTKSIYLKNHDLETGTKLVYSSNGGSPISISTDGNTISSLVDGQTLYAAKITKDLIGISTERVALGSNGTFVGIDSSKSYSTVFLTNTGSGNNHLFETVYDNVLLGDISKNLVTVSTASTHGLLVGDVVSLNCISGVTTSYKVLYNDYNRRLVFNPKSFISSQVNVTSNTITIPNHGYFDGQKVLHKSNSPAGGLEDEKIYYIIFVDNDTIKLSSSYYEATINNPKEINITSTSSGTLYAINPPIKATRNQTLVFDLSDNSLSYFKGNLRRSAFDFKFYYDEEYTREFKSTLNSNKFEVIKEGIVGIDSTAKVTLSISDNLIDNLYYKLVPIDLENVSAAKKEIIVDNEILDSNRLLILDSVYNGNHIISGIGSTTFTFSLEETPEKNTYTLTNSKVTYITNSSSAFGEIDSFYISSPGKYYNSLPGITSIVSDYGSNAILYSLSDEIGAINSYDIIDIGFDYSPDTTIRPLIQSPQILKLSNLSKFKEIKILSQGKKYKKSPNLVVVDSITSKVVNDVDLSYNIGDSKVNIITNTKGISNVAPKIIPVNNSNGIRIKSISYNSISKDVTVGLGVSYSSSSDFPFAVGDKILIENTSVGINSTAKGYNSSGYNYALFTIKSIDSNIGGANGSVTYNLSNYLSSGENPGVFDANNTLGSIVPEKYFPVFESILEKNNFIVGETVVNGGNKTGKVQKWDSVNEFLKIISNETFDANDFVLGKTSNSQSIISSVESVEGEYKVSSNSIVKKGWKLETGFLDNNQQRIHDNDYYQYFSYSLKSKIQYETWKNAVSDLNHTVGFKKFSDLIVESENLSSGISTEQNQGDFSGLADIISTIDLNCVNDFDLAFEITNNDSPLLSNEIIFNSRILQDYIESVGNRVLLVDDISYLFNNTPRGDRFSIVATDNLNNFKSKKIFAFIRDKRFTSEKQAMFASILCDGENSFLNQYGRVSTQYDIGSFEFNISGDLGNLLFYPQKYSINNFDVSTISYDIKDSTSGIGTISLGDAVKITSESVIVSAGTTTSTQVIGISSDYRSSKVLVQIGGTDGSTYEFNEITVIHDDNNVSILEYGKLTNTLSFSSEGLGTYDASLSGSNLIVNFTPNSSFDVDLRVNSLAISMSSGGLVGVGTEILSVGELKSSFTSIASTTSPTQNKISSYSSGYDGAYCIVTVEDTSNNNYQISESILLNDSSDVFIAEFGEILTSTSLGTISASIVGGNTEIYFTPIPNINAEVRVYQNSIGLVNSESTANTIDISNSNINSKNGIYRGTETDVKRSFDLYNRQNPIFVRNFDASSSDIVNIQSDIIKVPNHFFVTGEELRYASPGEGTSQSIGIASTVIVGIGTTDKLPSTVYAVKIDGNNIKLSSSAQNALLEIPNVLNLTSVGIGTSHRFISKNQNTKVLISIDNVIQSPIVSTSVTSSLLRNLPVSDDLIAISSSGISSFFGSDLIKINEEIMKINAVGFGSTNVLLVERGWMGTGISTHFKDDTVTKVDGNYNIVENTINFYTAPYGNVSLGKSTNIPSERDYVGLETHSTFSGRVFLRSGVPNTSLEPYSKNYIFDNISSNFNGITTQFTLKSNQANVNGISTNNSIVLINDIFQHPERLGGSDSIVGNYNLVESVGITSIQFVGNSIGNVYDVNTSNLPRGGIIVSVGSTSGFGYQPLVSAGGTAIVSVAGTISSISIGNSGSGYRSGIQTVNVGVYTGSLETPEIFYLGTATINSGRVVGVSITNPGVGYTSSNPPLVYFDSPLPYSNIPLIYSQSSVQGNGSNATIDIIVGQGSSVIDFEIRNLGYGYGQGEKLTVSIGGTVGIPTNISIPFKEFQVTVDRTQSDKFSAWTIGDLEVIDSFDTLFDGTRKSFPIKFNGVQKTIKTKPGSTIDVQATLLVFINDILQVPGESYIFKGGSYLTFTEAPKVGDKSNILFYRGTGDVDTLEVDILETIEPGDDVTLNSDVRNLSEDARIVFAINSSNNLYTNVYSGPGITNDSTYARPVKWCRQTEDTFIDGKAVTKDRILYEPMVYPTTNIIQNVGVGSTYIFVENVKSFFDNKKENTTEKIISKILLVSDDAISGAAATAVVSIAGTISSIILNNGGVGYTTNPNVVISNPIGLGTTSAAKATANVSLGSVTSISISSPGIGYTQTNPPAVFIEPPKSIFETISNVSYEGDFGIIVGVKTTNVGVSSTGIEFDLYIPQNSVLRNSAVVGTAITISGIQTGYYFVVSNSNVGNGVTSLSLQGSIVGYGNSFLDNVYQVSSVSIGSTLVPGVGTTSIAKVVVSVSNYNGLSGIGYSGFYGEFSWGKIYTPSRKTPQQFNYYKNGLSGISTSPKVIRVNPLRYLNYNS